MSDKETLLPGFPNSMPPGPGDSGDDQKSEQAGEARLKFVDRTQLLMRTVHVEHLIGEDHSARAIWEFVGKLDLSGYTVQIRSVAGTAGRPALD